MVCNLLRFFANLPGEKVCKIYFFGGTYALQKNIFYTPCRLQLVKKTPQTAQHLLYLVDSYKMLRVVLLL